MGLLDDAIREHLELKRRRGADPSEVDRAEREALGPVRRHPEPIDGSYDDPAAVDEELDYEFGPEEEYEEDVDAPAPRGGFAAPPAGAHAAEPYDPLEYDDDEWDDEPLAADGPPAGAGHETVEFRPDFDDPGLTGFAEGGHANFAEPVGPEFAEPESGRPAPEPAQGGLADPGHTEHGEPNHAGDEMLEETPEFLQDTPDHDRLWFEQRPPRDFDFDS
jgi:hypothetical protein